MNRAFATSILSLAATILFVAVPHAGFALEYYVAVDGADTNPGDSSSPYRTIQNGVAHLMPGDKLVVRAGAYDERVTTKRGGTNEQSRITIQAEGRVTMRGFSIQHPYITIDGFDITGHSAAYRFTGFVEVSSSGDYFQVLNNTIRDGIYLITDDVMFNHNSQGLDTVSSATGGFVAAGFKPGMSMIVVPATNRPTLTNADRALIIKGVTDNALTLETNQTVTTEGPVRACLDASYNYGIVVNIGASSGVVRSNLFTNLGYDAAFLSGDHNSYEFNIFEKCNGWNALRYSGSYNLFRRNWIRSSPWKVYVISPDALEDWSPEIVHHITFEENLVQGFDGALGIHHLATITNHGDLVFTRNVFMDAGRFAVKMQNVTFTNNTFLNVAQYSSAVIQADPHPLAFFDSSTYSAEGAVVKNNIFVGCGSQVSSVNLHGWYEFVGGITNYVATSNFVAGVAPSFASKTGFNEGAPELNGGDPGFVDISNPLGPDGLPFTADDGLRLRADSKLKKRGEGGVDIGAYLDTPAGPKLQTKKLSDGSIQLSWPSSFAGFSLQWSSNLVNGWLPETTVPTVSADIISVTVAPDRPAAYYRLQQ